jgi:hypothetical protein
VAALRRATLAIRQTDMVVSVKPFPTIPPFLAPVYFKRLQIGLQIVQHPSDADLVQFNVRGCADSAVFALDNDADRERAAGLITLLTLAFELGRRDVIDSVRSIFDSPRVA